MEVKKVKKKVIKSIFAGMLTLVIAITGFTYVPKEVRATDTAGAVKFQEVDYSTFETCIKARKVPQYTLEDKNTGYLFGGWYTESGEPIETMDAVAKGEAVAAKFVPAHLAGVACQVRADIGSAETTNLRAVSTVDSTNYQAVGFNVYGREKNVDGTYTEWQMYGHGTGRAAETTNIYSGLYVYEADVVTIKETVYPEDIFGADAAGFKFTTVSLTGIPKAAYDTIVAIKPYWITLDGTYVEGMGEFNRVNDSPDVKETPNIVNVSVNIKDAANIAAGMLNIGYDTANFEFVEAECGRIFEEMYFVSEDGVVKCVGNVKEIENAKEANDVYVNLRFQKKDGNSLQPGTAMFTITIPNKGFCDIDEQDANVSAWNVRY